MSDVRDRLRDAFPAPEQPDVADLWARGRRRHRRRRSTVVVAVLAVAGLGIALAVRSSDWSHVETIGSPDTGPETVEPDAGEGDIVASPLPTVLVPEGVELTVYPVDLPGWTITVTDQQEDFGEATTAALGNSTTGELAYLTWAPPADGDPPTPQLTWEGSRFEVDLGLPDGVEHTASWDGPLHNGSISVVGDTDPRALATELQESTWFDDPGGEPATGWSVILDTRRSTGGGVIRATAPDGSSVRLSTLLFEDPPSAEALSDFGSWAPAVERVPLLGTTAFDWNNADGTLVWNDDRSLHVVSHDEGPLAEFLDALVPVRSVTERVTVIGSTPAAADEAPSLSDHWHAAYAIVECGELLHVIEDQTDPVGIHTHADGLIHIHPFDERASGANARFAIFGDVLGRAYDPPRSLMEIKEQTWDLASCDGGPTEALLLRWHADRYDESPDVFRGDEWLDARFEGDREAWMIAMVPVGTDPASIEFPASRLETLAVTTGLADPPEN